MRISTGVRRGMKVKRTDPERRRKVRRRWLAILASVCFAAISFCLVAHVEQQRIMRTISGHLEDIQTVCQKYDDYRLGNGTAELQDIVNRAVVLSGYTENVDLSRTDVLERYARNVGLAGIVVLDGDLNVVGNVDMDGQENAALIDHVLSEEHARSVLEHPVKVFADHVQIEDRYYGYTLVARQGVEGVILCYANSVLLQNDKYELTLNTLLNLETLDSGEIVTVADGVNILATNAERLQGLAVKDAPIAQTSVHEMIDADHSVMKYSLGGRTWYGLHETYRNSYHIYISYPLSASLRRCAVQTLAVFAAYIMACLLALGIRQYQQRKRLLQVEKEYHLISAIGSIYSVNLLIYPDEDRWEALLETPLLRKIVGDTESAREMLAAFCSQGVAENDQEGFARFADLNDVSDRLRGKAFEGFSFEDCFGRWYQAQLIPQWHGTDGKLASVMFLLHNMTDQRRREMDYQERLRKMAEEAALANAAKTDFLRRMGHDLRTPINGIRGMAEIGRSCGQDASRSAECFDKILSVSGFLLELVNNVLDMSKLEAGETHWENAPFDMREVLHNILVVIESQATDRNVEILAEKPKGEHWHLIGSPLNVQRVIQNIISNAVKYNRPGGSVQLSFREECFDGEKATFVFVCADTGIGMSEEFQAHAFETFAQEDGSVRTSYAGSGLGLPIAKRTVEYLGGTIDFVSERNRGTTFTVRLPLPVDKNHMDAPVCEAKPARQDGVEGVNILLAEDNPLNREIAEYMLRERGARVVSVENGQAALDCFAASAPGEFDLILMDIQMPKMDGMEATRRIRALSRPDAAKIPIFAMTANAFPEDIAMGREAGMNEHMSKPLDFEEVVGMIWKYVKK